MSAYPDVDCPECGGKMLARANRSSGGQKFWGCAAYPKCKGTRNTDGEARRVIDAAEREPESPSDRFRSNDRQRWRHQG